MNAPTGFANVTLEDKYALERGTVFMTGTQALVRLAMLQRSRDMRAGLNTAGFISGYRGSPLGGFDQALWRAHSHLERHHVRFQPGVNEELAATAVWGTQQLELFKGARYDGVFGMWYGKGPGVDRCGDVFKHANSAGTAKHGGVLVLAGDDHAAKSSTLAHQSEHAFKAAMIPVLNPASVQEYLDLGLHGFAMSRYSGCWVAFKCVTDVVESGASVAVDPDRVRIELPGDFAMPPGGLNIRWPDGVLEQEARLLDWKVYAALAYARANGLDRVVWDSPRARLGIVTTGKSFGDTMQALADLGIDERVAADIGLRVYKVGMSWPLEPDGARRFADGLEEILVVEEKRQVIEYQIKEELYSWEPGRRPPRVVGKFDDNGEWSHADGSPAGRWLLPAHHEHSPALVARAIAMRLERLGMAGALGSAFRDRIAFLDAKDKALARPRAATVRTPHFCSGCPHNTSTVVPKGSRALGGIGCHYMVTWMNRRTATFTHMGGEGAPWIGQAPFTDETHVFANLGDGTYFHSGLLAIRAAVAAKVNITYKILYNDAVAMTGGQHVDGPLDPAMISRQIAAEGVAPIVVVTDEPEKYPAGIAWAPGVTVRHRDDLDSVQLELRKAPGVSAIIYDQTCAAEKRRRRKRGTYPDPALRTLINEAVCEGCGDCSYQSNCLSVEPVETEFGRKRRINQSSCNKDFSCLKGFCPSFVTIEGGTLRRATMSRPDTDQELPAPETPSIGGSFGILVAGIGGTGVVTIGEILAMAGHLEGKAVTVLDQSGLAQKYGAVMSHVQIAEHDADIRATRIDVGGARLLLGCDLVVAAGNDSLLRLHPEASRAVINATPSPTADFIRNPDWQLPGGDLARDVAAACGPGHAAAVPASELASKLVGDAIGANMFVLGYALQKGWLPLSLSSVDRAIELNGVAVELNRSALAWGRLAAVDGAAVDRAAAIARSGPAAEQLSNTLDERIQRRVRLLTDYQDEALAARYAALVTRVRDTEARRSGSEALTEAVARCYAKLLAYKDEYEVARLHADPAFRHKIDAMFEGDYTVAYHLAPPLLARRDPVSGEPRKLRFGPWMLGAFSVLHRFKFLRGTVLDPFGHTAERRAERALIAEYEADIEWILRDLESGGERERLEIAVNLASLPDGIRGFGHVKRHSMQVTARKRDVLLAELHRRETTVAVA